MKEWLYDLLYDIGDLLDTLGWKLRQISIHHWRNYCKHCGIEGGYGHKKECPNETK
jgi:hypothetical protein